MPSISKISSPLEVRHSHRAYIRAEYNLHLHSFVTYLIHVPSNCNAIFSIIEVRHRHGGCVRADIHLLADLLPGRAGRPRTQEEAPREEVLEEHRRLAAARGVLCRRVGPVLRQAGLLLSAELQAGTPASTYWPILFFNFWS